MYWLTMIKRLVLFFCLCLPALAVSAQEQEVKFAFDNYHRYYREARLCTDSAKLEAMKKLRVYFHEHPYRLSKVNMSVPPARCLELLTPEGTFSDMDALEAEFERSNAYRKGFHTTADDRVGIFIGNALDRLCCIADAYRRGALTADESLSDKVLKAVVHYGMLEAGRSNAVSRFHASCFAIPTAAVNIYFAWLDKMELAERGGATPLLEAACDMLKVLGLQAYTQPLRHDETDKNVVSI